MAKSGVWGLKLKILSVSPWLSTDTLVCTKCCNTYKCQKFLSMLDEKMLENNCLNPYI